MPRRRRYPTACGARSTACHPSPCRAPRVWSASERWRDMGSCCGGAPAAVIDPFRAGDEGWTVIYPHEAQRLFPSEETARAFMDSSHLRGRFTLVSPDGDVVVVPD